MLLFDTLSAARQPLPDGPVKLYVCGVTPYDTTHLGHAFTFAQFDVLVRALRWLYPGREVVYVQNVTDVDDSILARARKLGVNWRELGDKQTADYREDMQRLNVAEPTHFVRATSAIPTMLLLAQRLIENGSAYVVEGGSVFFRVRSVPSYGELSKLSRDEMLEIASRQDEQIGFHHAERLRTALADNPRADVHVLARGRHGETESGFERSLVEFFGAHLER